MLDPSKPVQCILLDIEGTTSSISFVHDVMFPFVLEHLDTYLSDKLEDPQTQAACEQIAVDAGYHSLTQWAETKRAESRIAVAELVKAEVRQLMSTDAKTTGLKALQGLIWDSGFRSGELQSHVFPDVLPAIRTWRDAGIDVRIYSSGSVAAQKLFFGHVADIGDCLHLFSGHYDTQIGGKKESQSYQRIADDWRVVPERILFVSDVPQELQAAASAGLQVCGSQRPGNAAIPLDSSLTWIHSFDEITRGLTV